MGSVSKADWAALVPWSGIQDKPPFADGPDGNIKISDVQGLQAALDSKQSAGGLAKVAYSGSYKDLHDTPPFGSAAFANVSDFQKALTAKQLQTGTVKFVAGTQSYTVVFSQAMEAIPKLSLQVLMADATGELFCAIVQEDTLDETGFTFWLNGVPSLSTGKVRWRAATEGTDVPVTPVAATGGTVTVVGLYTIHTFDAGGSFDVSSGGAIDFLVVGGGGGGGGFGGGGGGGFQKRTAQAIGVGSFPVVIGAGGVAVAGGAHAGEQGGDGGSSSFNGVTAVGGGGGGAFSDTVGAGRAGASGGGGGTLASSPFTGQPGGAATDGFAGGSGVTGATSAGGGGGHGGLGHDGSGSTGGAGGDGTSDSISGSATPYAGGGGGAGSTTGGVGGSSVGGTGGAYNGDAGPGATAAVPNSGGGGGGKYANSTAPATAGATGIVIIRYLTA